MQTKTPLIFEPNSENSERLEKLCQVTNLGVTELVNVLLDWPLTQIVDQHDSGLLQPVIQSFEYDTKEEALEIIARYERFISEDEPNIYHPDAKPARTRDGHWEIKFKSTHPSDEGARYQ
jgi:hypothetical protein